MNQVPEVAQAYPLDPISVLKVSFLENQQTLFHAALTSKEKESG